MDGISDSGACMYIHNLLELLLQVKVRSCSVLTVAIGCVCLELHVSERMHLVYLSPTVRCRIQRGYPLRAVAFTRRFFSAFGILCLRFSRASSLAAFLRSCNAPP